MTNFFEVLFNPYTPFLRYALLIGIISSFTFGIIGTYVVTKRISYIAGAVSHSILGGIGAGIYYNFNPIIGAFIAAIVSALIIGSVSIYAQEREDTVIGAIWAVGMALGIIFISQTPGYNTSLISYLFGSILIVSGQDIIFIIILNIAILLICFCFYNKFLAICFDEEHARLKGIKTSFYYLLLLCLVAISIVLLVRIVGVIMVVALLTIPPAIAGYFSKRFFGIIIISVLLCAIFNIAGIYISFALNFPSGPTIVIIGALVYVVVATLRLLWL